MNSATDYILETCSHEERSRYIKTGLNSSIKIMTDEKPKTRLEEAQQELDTFNARAAEIKHQQWLLTVEVTALKKKIKATEEEIEQLTPVTEEKQTCKRCTRAEYIEIDGEIKCPMCGHLKA